MKKSMKTSMEYLDWYFTCDDGTADKDAQKAWFELREQITNRNTECHFKKQEVDCGKDKNEPLKISRDWVDEYHGYVAACPECDCFWIMYRDEDMNFCPGCGKEVKWND